MGRRGGRRSRETAGVAALLPAIALIPVWFAALAVFWLLVRLVWQVPLWLFALGYLAAGVVLLLRPVQRLVLAPLLGARRPTADERARLDPAWRAVCQLAGVSPNHHLLAVLPSEEVNAYACGGHLVVVTSYAIESLPTDELCGVLAHELSHHLGLHTVTLALAQWLSLPVLVLARIGFFLRNVSVAATDAFASSSRVLTVIGRAVAAVMWAASAVLEAGLVVARRIGGWVGRRSEFEADDRVVQLGLGPELVRALHRVNRDGATTANGATTSHPPARTRIARIDAALRRRRRGHPHPSPFL